jgi:hypothetical protein
LIRLITDFEFEVVGRVVAPDRDLSIGRPFGGTLAAGRRLTARADPQKPGVG